MIDGIKCEFDDMIKEAFYMFDSGGSGTIGCDEFRRVMMTLWEQITDEEVNEIFNVVNE